MRKLFQHALALVALASLAWVQPASAAASSIKSSSAKSTAPKTQAKGVISRNPYIGAIVIDAVSGQVLIDDHADAKGYPASMLKMIDLLIVEEKLQKKELSLQDQVPVSAKSSKTGGSQVWLAEKESFTLDEMLYALMVQSANDAAVAIAEKVAGSTDAFIELMNQKAQQLGMTSTVFNSVHGLPPEPGKGHDITTARDFSILCRHVLMYPDTLRYTSTRERTFRPDGGKKAVIMHTHNHLLGALDGCDGLKTGYITSAGFSIAVTAARNNHRLIAVVLGSSDRKVRDAKAAELINKGFALLAAQPAPAPKPAPAASAVKKK